jgi:hypothetical protein
VQSAAEIDNHIFILLAAREVALLDAVTVHAFIENIHAHHAMRQAEPSFPVAFELVALRVVRA